MTKPTLTMKARVSEDGVETLSITCDQDITIVTDDNRGTNTYEYTRGGTFNYVRRIVLDVFVGDQRYTGKVSFELQKAPGEVTEP